MTDSDMLPLVMYGLKQLPCEEERVRIDRYFIIFSCLMPGILVRMQNVGYMVLQSYAKNPAAGHYVLEGQYERVAKKEGDHVYRLAHALQRIEGLYCLIITPAGLVAKGEEHMAERADTIIPQMHQALKDVCGPLDSFEVPGNELWIPTFKNTEQAEKLGMRLPF